MTRLLGSPGRALLSAALLAAGPGALSAQLRDPVRIETGRVAGVTTSTPGVRGYLGIPFAAPPVGALRWREPQAAAKWEGVRPATHFAASCIQNLASGGRNPWTSEFMVQGEISEDCLYLNVWTAARSASERRPVLVYIHGGGYNEGSGSIEVYNGEQLATKGLVAVTINYRVGPLGFFVHPQLTRESPHMASGNYGLADIAAALRWVHANAAAFGGDPSRVTIVGQSAGAQAVNAMVASPLAKGLFQRAIAESPVTFLAAPMPTLASAERGGLAYGEARGARTLAELRAIPALELFNPQPGSPRPPSRPVVDGWVLPLDVTAAMAQGKYNDVPTITGMQADEWSGLAAATYGKIPAEQFSAQSRQRYGAQADAFLRLYPSATQEQSAASQREFLRDQDRVAMDLWAAGRAKTSKTPAYTYYFTRAIPWPQHPEFGAFHTGEVPYVFGTLAKIDRPWTDVDRSLSQTVMSYWANFAAKGDPNGPGVPRWPAFDPQARTTLELGDRVAPRPIADPERYEMLAPVLKR